MDKPTEKKEKVIIIPSPPRSSFEQWVPVTPEDAEAHEAAQTPRPDEPVAPIVPDAGPVHNVVEGPAQGLAGAPAEEEAAEEE